jgi:hypothetical protein
MTTRAWRIRRSALVIIVTCAVVMSVLTVCISRADNHGMRVIAVTRPRRCPNTGTAWRG